VAGAAMLLPLGSTSGLGQVLEWAIGLGFRIVVGVLLLLTSLVSLLLYPFRFLLKPGGEESIGVQSRPVFGFPTQT
jgi:hypothetical protein